MQKWYFEELQYFQPEVGFRTQFLIELDEQKYTHLWEITEVIPKQKIAYSWKYEECEGEGLVIFELAEYTVIPIMTIMLILRLDDQEKM